MAAKLVLAPEAENDLAEAYDWYEDQRPGLGEDVAACVEACLQRIRRNPLMHAMVHTHYRRALVRRFPYSVFYDYADDVVTVLCVFHTARDPEKWRRRLR